MDAGDVALLASLDAQGVASGASRVICLCLAGLVALAAAHKIRVLAAGTPSAEPLMQVTAWRRRHAARVLGLAAAVEVAITAALLAAPGAGLGAALLMLGVYSWDLRRLPADESCNCMGNFLSHTRSAALRRNAVLAALAAAAFVAALTGAAPVAAISQPTVGATLIVGAIVLAVDVLPKTARRAGVAAAPMGQEDSLAR